MVNKTTIVNSFYSGLIGRSWAMIFASVGYKVYIYDIEQSQIDGAIAEIKVQFETLEKEGTLRGKLSAAKQFELIRGKNNINFNDSKARF